MAFHRCRHCRSPRWLQRRYRTKPRLSVQSERQRDPDGRVHRHLYSIWAPRGPRRALFGALVPWDSVWHPGADSATRITFSRDILIEGKPLRAGEYTLWLIPHERTPWTVIFSRAAHVFHKPYPGANLDVLRVNVTPEQASPMESFAIYFPMVLRDEAVLRLHWGTTAVPIRIKAPFRPNP